MKKLYFPVFITALFVFLAWHPAMVKAETPVSYTHLTLPTILLV